MINMKLTVIAILFSLSASAQKDTTDYNLKGKKMDFQFLRFAIQHPADITPNQDSAIVRWIETIKPEEKKELKTK